MAEFATQEIILPNGPRKGMRFNLDTQPWVRLWLEEVDSGRWNEFWTTGGRQGGKTLVCSQLPLLYHLFEVGESVIYLLPDMKLASYKWNNDIRPVIMRTRYRDLLPTTGAGSRGGDFDEIEFRNGAHLIFMGGGGGAAGRQGRTARVLIATEVNKLTESDENEETDKLNQAKHCLDAFGESRRMYCECTQTTPEGAVASGIRGGTDSKILLKCPLCGVYVTPEREHLTGWEECDNELDVRDEARYHCPSCAAPWTEEQRHRANHEAKLLHKGQSVGADGKIEGDLPRTRTLGFRWSAVNNMFLSAGDVAVDHWKLQHEEDEAKRELKEREVLQYLWALPYESKIMTDTVELTYQGLLNRQFPLTRGQVPAWASYLTVGCDVGERLCHWAALAWDQEARGHIVDYGVIEIPSDLLGVERALPAALRDWRDNVVMKGWGVRIPDQVCIDSRFCKKEVLAFCHASGGRFQGCMGYGTVQRKAYSHPKAKTGVVVSLGDNYYLVRDGSNKILNVNSDHWKTWFVRRLLVPIEAPAAVTLFKLEKKGEHDSYIKHLRNERQTEKFMPGRGPVTVWEMIKSWAPNHWLDASTLACVAAHLAGVRLSSDEGSRKKKIVVEYGSREAKASGWKIGR